MRSPHLSELLKLAFRRWVYCTIRMHVCLYMTTVISMVWTSIGQFTTCAVFSLDDNSLLGIDFKM